jgi:hypothetical protein
MAHGGGNTAAPLLQAGRAGQLAGRHEKLEKVRQQRNLWRWLGLE